MHARSRFESLAPLRWTSAALSLVLAALPASAQKDADKVTLRAGSVELGKVVEEGFAGVTLQPEKGAKKTFPWDDVQNVEYSDAPEALGSAMATLGAGNLPSALTQFQAVLDEADVRPPLVQQSLFYSAFIQQRQGESADATKRYESLLEDFPSGRYVGLAAENLINLKLDARDAAGAEKVVEAVAASAKDVPALDAQARLLRGWLLESQGKFPEAREAYSGAETAAGAPKSAVQEAKLGKGRTLLRENKRTEAEPIFRALVSEPSSARVQSGAWNCLGELLAEEGRSKRNYDVVMDGLCDYLRTVVQYKPLLGESTREYERALAGAATCFQYLSDMEQNPEKKKLLRERARERTDQLRQEYPNSPFAKDGKKNP